MERHKQVIHRGEKRSHTILYRKSHQIFCFTVLIVSLLNCKASTSCMKKASQQFIRDMKDDAG
jgi:hypothetical protein